VTDHNALNFIRGLAVQAPGWSVVRNSNRNRASIAHESARLAVELLRQHGDVWACEVTQTTGSTMWPAARATPWSAVKAAVTRAHTALVEARVDNRLGADRREAARAQAAAMGALLTVVLASAPSKAQAVDTEAEAGAT
jgi:hypothetical protein